MTQYLIAPLTGARQLPDWSTAELVRPVRVTPLQAKLLAFIRDRQRAGDGTPTYREMANLVGLSGCSSVRHHLVRLADLGLLALRARTRRALVVNAIPVKLD